MADCEFCGQGMNEADSCTKNAVLYPAPPEEPIDGVYRLAVPYGEEDNWEAQERCHDCGVPPGGYHHPGCDVEQSPVTGEQLLREVLEHPAESAPLHARAEPDPHEQISMDEVIEQQRGNR